ncbi:uncharacterized protein BCR38DRAFT_474407 [Pseudomassariella vexata]|uniref:Short-chain dehydrogenase n=1 Tax=Pseudomassariella vexata TaxID=1141098 RepID=A0A1Y2E2F5_9PEZI|nr:uncharacterized protein BCR38DRAFT_474407 [Pseudomassariella vexata]ORY65534.1 hypothetical protein BCR38DRAFT_474407 [Pseudomassariella vexata]
MSLISKVPFQLSGRYAEHNKWENLNGPSDSRVTGKQIIEDEGLVDAWSDKVVFITGVSSGMGPETVRVMALTGATVFGTARNLEKAKKALGASLLDSGRVHLLFMDQTDLSSVRACAAEFRKQSPKLNVLINNAGLTSDPGNVHPEQRTQDGFELQFGTNHLSHFLLFHLLSDVLLASSTPSFHSRVINVSSSGHRYGPLRLDDLNFDSAGTYEGWAAYGSSKTANIYMANAIERRYGARGLHGLSLNPGSFVSPNLQQHCQESIDAAQEVDRMQKYFVSLEQACATSVYGAVSKDLEGKGGLYLEGASVAGPVPEDGDAVEYGYAMWAFDEGKEEQLWRVSERMIGVDQRQLEAQ